jgi:hypothetical protein
MKGIIPVFDEKREIGSIPRRREGEVRSVAVICELPKLIADQPAIVRVNLYFGSADQALAYDLFDVYEQRLKGAVMELQAPVNRFYFGGAMSTFTSTYISEGTLSLCVLLNGMADPLVYRRMSEGIYGYPTEMSEIRAITEAVKSGLIERIEMHSQEYNFIKRSDRPHYTQTGLDFFCVDESFWPEL